MAINAKMMEAIAEPLRVYLLGIKNETSATSLIINLRFVLALTNNQPFMKWAKVNAFDLFSIMEKNMDKHFINLECIEWGCKIQHNLLLDLNYSGTFLNDPRK